MTLLQWWFIPIWVVVVAFVVLAIVLLRRRSTGDAIAVAHAERLTALPGYRRLLVRYRVLVGALALVLVIGFVAAAALTVRAATVTVQRQDLASRDIVLCLDVSGSMVDYDSEVVDVFAELAKKFEGERLSLVVFNASAVTYFPLTSDLSYIEAQFARIKAEFASPDQSYFDGTLFGNGSSLVGDGLASCVTRFPDAASARSRSVILVTDNVVVGQQAFTLPEAGQLARSRDVHVFGVNPGDTAAKDYLSELSEEMRTTVVSTGGAYYALGDPDAIPDIVGRITSEQAALTQGPARVVYEERTAVATWLLIVTLLGVVAIGWVVRR